MRLLLVEDDHDLAEAMVAAFLRRQISCDQAESLDDALQLLKVANYAAIILDLGLPDGNGLSLLRKVREKRNPIAVLILTARSDVSDRIGGLDAGADDYLVKPFEFGELFARLAAIMRRQSGLPGNIVTLGNMQLDLLSHELLVAGKLLVLSAREAELVDLLVRRAGRVIAKTIVEDQLFGMSESLGSNAIEVYVHRLRRKLESAGADVRIETVRGVGYLLRGGA